MRGSSMALSTPCWPICAYPAVGSGVVESGRKDVGSVRLKPTGMR